MWLELTLLIVGFVALIWSADKFLAGAAATAADAPRPKKKKIKIALKKR